MTDSLTNREKVMSFHSFVQISSRLQMPSNNILIYSTRTAKKRARETRSSNVIKPPIHQIQSNRQNASKNDNDNGDNPTPSKYLKLRLSLLQQKRKKRDSINSSCHSIYEKDIKKSKSLVLKKDFEFAFKKLIGKKQFSSKQTKQIGISDELWKSMKMKKQTNVKGEIIKAQCFKTSRPSNPKCLEQGSNRSQNKIVRKGTNKYYKRTQHTPKICQLYLSGLQLNKAKIPYLKMKEKKNQQGSNIKGITSIKAEGQIKPWIDESRRYKTQVNQGRSSEITDWFNGSKND